VVFPYLEVEVKMEIQLKQKKTGEVFPTDIVFQTAFWSSVKSQLGWKPLAFDFDSPGLQGDVLVMTRASLTGISMAHVPQGPEFCPDIDHYGIFLEALSDAISKYLDPGTAFIRYDLPWESPYSVETANDSIEPELFRRPEARLQELRMNIGTKGWNLRKAVINHTFADKVVVDLREHEEKIMSQMKPKTRYNIRLAQKKGVNVFPSTPDLLPAFYDLYRQTAKRNRLHLCDYKHFFSLFSALSSSDDTCEILFLLASHGHDLLAGALVVISGQTATYLFGASSNEKRNLMASYAIHWTAIQLARSKGCLSYDLGAVSPEKDPEHPFYGLYRFKTGFGGKIVHQSGSWDYPLNDNDYNVFRNCETFDGFFHTV
jgi:lipid II:glycine glycyltransferase (peptidoglycan interpeptide bridge formation enzyme)